ncbi:MAG TPA: glycogen synthase GlgA [Candidatus Didemnitutus sp.]|nr:glycogen synthase GlgA [Candidatus Didemnitutus sp.]
MRIVHVASEMYPLIKTGGLADVVGALSTALAARGHEVAVCLPAYRPLLESPLARDAVRAGRVVVHLGVSEMVADVWQLSPSPHLTINLIARDEFFDRRHLYWNGERDYDDNDARFIFFCAAVVEHLRGQAAPADVVHGHDWQAGLLPLLLRHAEQRSGIHLARRTVFTVHNLIYQGLFPRASFALTNLHPSLNAMDGIEYYGKISTLKAGLMYADQVTTVSPNYAREMATPEHGYGLEGVVRLRNGAVRGIRNGIDTSVWNPATDRILAASYDAQDLTGKATCRRALGERFGWRGDDSIPLFAIVSRITEAKGHDILSAALDRFRRKRCRLIVAGTGDPILLDGYRRFAAAHPEFLTLVDRYDEDLSHAIIAGADFFLMPSHTEPCGLTQMYALNYGTIPLASRVGGLVDTVTDIEVDPAHGTGIMFEPKGKAFNAAVDRALKLFSNVARCDEIRRRGMAQDFSWASVVGKYEALYAE